MMLLSGIMQSKVSGFESGLSSEIELCGACGNCTSSCNLIQSACAVEIATPPANGFRSHCSTGFESGIDATFLTHGLDGYDTSIGNRIWVGYQLNPYWSMRMRFWNSDFRGSSLLADSQATGSPFPTGAAIADSTAARLFYTTIDVEARRAFYWRGIEWEASTGLRYASRKLEFQGALGLIDFSTDQAALLAVDSIDDVDSVGVTFGIDLAKRLARLPRISLIANLQGSVVGGVYESDSQLISLLASTSGGQLTATPPPLGIGDVQADVGMWIGEAQLGLQFTHQFGSRCAPQFFARALFEASGWSTSTIEYTVNNMPFRDSFSDSLTGFVFSVGLQR